MPTTTGVGNIDTFNLIQVIGNHITDNVTDIRTDRSNSRWVFPTLPKDKSNYPEAVVEIKNVNYNEDSAGRVLCFEELDSGNYAEYYYRHAFSDVIITVLTEKESQFTVTRNSTEMFLTNQPLNLYICNSISDAIKWGKDDLLDYFMDIKETRKTPVFEDSPQVWASEIRIEVEFYDVWLKTYSSDGELVDEYSLTLTATMED